MTLETPKKRRMFNYTASTYVAKQYHGRLEIRTSKKTHIFDITDKVNDALKSFKTKNGIVVVATTHTTTGIAINENEKGLKRDIEDYLAHIVPENRKYIHNDTHLRKDCPPDEPKNADAHIKALLLPTSVTIPYQAGRLSLGKWQSVFFLELDGPCPRPNKDKYRTLTITAMGD